MALLTYEQPLQQPSRLRVVIPEEAIYEADSGLIDSIGQAQSRQYLTLANESDHMVVDVDLARIGKMRNKNPAMAMVNDCFFKLGSVAETSLSDPRARVSFGNEIEDGLPSFARVRWPEAEDFRVAEVARRMMLGTAQVLNYNPRIAKKTYAITGPINVSVEREEGIFLTPKPNNLLIGVGTIGRLYCSEEPMAELFERGKLSATQKVICLAGAIAIAHADELLQQAA